MNDVSEIIAVVCANICEEWEKTHSCCYIPEVSKYMGPFSNMSIRSDEMFE